MPEEAPTTFFMISLIIQQLYREILAVADEEGGKLKNRCMFFCDEFGTIPKITVFRVWNIVRETLRSKGERRKEGGVCGQKGTDGKNSREILSRLEIRRNGKAEAERKSRRANTSGSEKKYLARRKENRQTVFKDVC